MRVERLAHNPIIRPEMLPGNDGANINGPSLIRVPDWVEGRMGVYHLYFAHHQGTYIRLAYADHLEGPWTIYRPGTLRLEDAPGCRHHIASPDVHVDHDRRELRMYFHGPTKLDRDHRQQTFVAVSHDGVHFDATDQALGRPYWRAFPWNGWWYAMARHGVLYRSRDGLNDFEEGPSPFHRRSLVAKLKRRVFGSSGAPGTSLRHLAVHRHADTLWTLFTNIGDRPERILGCRIALSRDWARWKTSPPDEVIRPEASWEGAQLPVTPSRPGAATGPEHALRDPAVFAEDERVFVLYSVAGESGIAIAEWRP